jgi:hypothetical protein
MFAITYEPPVWVQKRTQNEMKNCTDSYAIYKHGQELWENSGGARSGFEEFLKYCEYLEAKDICQVSFAGVSAIWNGYAIFGKTYNPFSNASWCRKCRKYVYGCCEICHQEKIVMSVALFCID